MKHTVLERFLAKVSPEAVSGCWLWKGHVRRNGYGTFTEGRKTRGAHRMAWILLRGEIPAGMLVCHTCDQPCCVNPEHLFLGTHLENVQDMMRKGRARTGARHPFAKLDVAKVARIKAMLAQGVSQSEAARQWGVCLTTIHAIARGKTWREVEPSDLFQEAVTMADFHQAFEFTMQHEDSTRSGRVTTDAGGRTRFGIAEKFHPSLPEEFFTGPIAEALAIVEMIERKHYWEPMRLGEIENQNVANKLFDMAVNMGTHQAGVYAQRGANGLLQSSQVKPSSAWATRLLLSEDGVIGEKTLATINSLDPIRYHQVLCELSAAHYRHVAALNPAQAVNLAGWLKRAEA